MPSLPSLPSHLALPSRATKLKTIVLSSLNFYRVHLITFTIVPLITSAIMYACNTEYHIAYIDCLFCCMSAMTVTGLATINLSTLSVVQQVILFVQMIIGSLSFVSILMIFVRQYFFRQSFKHVLKQHQAKSRGFNLSKTFSRVATMGPPLSALKKKFSKDNKKEKLGSKDGSPEDRPSTPSLEMKAVPPSPKKAHEFGGKNPKKHEEPHKSTKKKGHQKLRTDMIKRVSGGGVGLVNPMGWYEAERAQIKTPAPTPEHQDDLPLPADNGGVLGLSLDDGRGVQTSQQLENALNAAVDRGQAEVKPDSILGHSEFVTASPAEEENIGLPPSPKRKVPYAGLQLGDDAFPRSKTIAFDDEPADAAEYRGATTQRENGFFPRAATFRSAAGENRFPRTATVASASGNFPRTYSLRPTTSNKPDTKLSGFGGFPTPLEIGKKVFRRAFPEASHALTQTLTMGRTPTTMVGRTATIARTNTTVGRGSVAASGTEKEVPYISFAAVIGRNSRFRDLTQEQMDELGGVEYRALRVLLYIVAGYFICLQLAGFVIIAPYIAAGGRYDHVFEAQPRLVKIPWFAFFQSVSAFTNTGMSLCDMSMIPFQKAYLMIVVVMLLIFAGNTAFGRLYGILVADVLIMLDRWLIYKLVPSSSRISESLKFLLDHPRRCFVYLFPSTQTWVLCLVMLSLTLIDWVSFLVLDIGTPAIESLPIGTRVGAGFLQSAAVRSAGFGIVPLGSLAPAVKVLYVIMMYISVYPLALSVRATNVYEEKSLGLFGEEEEDEFGGEGEGAQAVAKYIGWHARRQLAFDIWWLGFALWLVCIIERGHLDNDEDNFNIFNVIFELVSAYGTVGLSLGVTYDNFSFCGSFRKLSKLVVIAVMLRGRHRGLPVAIDRAVMLPKDFTAAEETAFEEERSRRASRRGSMMFADDVFSGATRRSSFGAHSFNGMHSAREVSPIPGPQTALPGQHHHHIPGAAGAMNGSPSYPHNALHPLSGGPTQSQSQAQAQGHRRSSSVGAGTIPGSPSSGSGSLGGGGSGGLQFSLPRESFDRERPGRGIGALRPGALPPVRESSMSRGPTRVNEDDFAIV
ncbi:potassium ion transporter [Kwoniella heveanensis BCC8398]|uniref:Potassium transport protein n=1 Tax=Kwoniella heveanensis BCC8398 TaxID=1296120 RepID=A0A1B9GJI9_9TREE|nr:potassium ion transporter [Kwoniella heveanensis BCC8398]